MKKLVTILLVAMLAVSCVCALAACSKPLANPDFEYVITGQFNGWKVNTDENDETKLDAQYQMEAIAASDKRVKSIKDQLKDAKYLYIAEHEFVNEGAGWTIEYALSEGADLTVLDGNMAIKVIKTKYDTLGETASWSAAWLPDAGGTTFKSLTPTTLYMPPHSEAPTYPNSGAWNDNPVVLEAGTYYIVFAEFTDGTFGLGAIAK